MRGSSYDATNGWLQLSSRPKIGRGSEITKPRSADQRKVWTSAWLGSDNWSEATNWSEDQYMVTLSKCDLRLDPVEKRLKIMVFALCVGVVPNEPTGERSGCWQRLGRDFRLVEGRKQKFPRQVNHRQMHLL